jgi:hypothetical protein
MRTQFQTQCVHAIIIQKKKRRRRRPRAAESHAVQLGEARAWHGMAARASIRLLSGHGEWKSMWSSRRAIDSGAVRAWARTERSRHVDRGHLAIPADEFLQLLHSWPLQNRHDVFYCNHMGGPPFIQECQEFVKCTKYSYV